MPRLGVGGGGNSNVLPNSTLARSGYSGGQSRLGYSEVWGGSNLWESKRLDLTYAHLGN